MQAERPISITLPRPGVGAVADLQRKIGILASDIGFIRHIGRVVLIADDHFRASGLSRIATLGARVRWTVAGQNRLGEIIRIEPDEVFVKPFATRPDVRLHDCIALMSVQLPVPCLEWRGRVLNALCEPIDELGALPKRVAPDSPRALAPTPMQRRRVEQPLRTGIKAIDIFTPLCAGQRIGIFAGSGVGKSTLLALLAQGVGCDTLVCALVGERGREARELADELMALTAGRAILIVATSEEGAIMRRLAAETAVATANALAADGQNVFLLIDSITRYAHALREIAGSSGELPVARGYPPSVFARIAGLFEKTGAGGPDSGAVTVAASVLVDGDDHNEPVADTVRGLLDGHIVLSRTIASQGRFPAVDIGASLSRLAQAAHTEPERLAALRLRQMIARYEETRDLRMMGALREGQDALLDLSVRIVPKVYDWLQQTPGDAACRAPFDELGVILRELSADAPAVPV